MIIGYFTEVKKGFANPCVGPGPVSGRSKQPLSGLPDPDPGHSLSLRPRPEAAQGTDCPGCLDIMSSLEIYKIRNKRKANILFPLYLITSLQINVGLSLI